jgi:C1A family cysteine protease
VVLAAIAAVALYNYDNTPSAYSFEQFKADHQKVYAREGEEQYRKTIFLRNLVKIAEHNANSQNTYQLGVNQFTDLTDAEFAAIYLTLNVPQKTVVISEESISVPNGDIDWQTAGHVTDVKNQGSCGSCWAFSATAALESILHITRGTTLNLSEQQLVDCSRSYGNQGCNGGWMDSAFQYIRDKGITTTDQYPYVARDQTCKIDSGATKVTGFVDVPGCDNLSNALAGRPISVAVDAGNWSPYRSGVFSSCGTAVNHGVLLIGSTEGFWRVKNSWGTGWGETGFIRLAKGNTCAICSYPSYPTV